MEREGPAPRGPGTIRPAGLDRSILPPPRSALPRLRRLFDPVSGWIRRGERRLNRFLGCRVYPRLSPVRRLYSWQLEHGLTVSEAEVPVAGLPSAFEGATVLLITDIHAGPFLAPEALERVFRRLMALRPDLILLGGDLTTDRVSEFDGCAGAFGCLTAPLGLFGVLGNHDHYTGDPEGLRRSMERAGIAVLHNRSVALERMGQVLLLAGIDDLNWGRPDLERALAGTRGKGRREPVILLSHNPDVFFQAAQEGVALVLAGHTHGGQIRLPGLPVLVRMSRFGLDQGHYQMRPSQLVVSRGLGATGLPLRMACPPEVVALRLRRAPL